MICNCSNECKCDRHGWDGSKFWIVIRVNGGGGGHNKFVRHPTKEVAEKEAKRLTTLERSVFFVMESVSGFQPPEQVEPVVFQDKDNTNNSNT